MKKIFILGAVVLVAVGAYVLFGGQKTTGGFVKYSSAELGLVFSYPSGPTGYILEEKAPTSESDKELVRTLILWQVEDKKNIDAGNIPVGGEGPATMSILVFKNPQKQSPSIWAAENALYSNINLRTSDPVEDVIGGVSAIRYIADGLYPSENFIVAHGENIYVFTGQYQSPESPLKRDFLPIVASVAFISQPGQK